MNEKINSLEYFAALEDPDRLASEMINKIRIYRDWANGTGLIPLWQKKLKNYYGISDGGNTSQAITSGGSEGELAFMKVNDLHNLIQNQLVIVTSQRPAGIAKAINSDTKSLRASRIGTAIAEFYMSRPELGYEQKFVNATECALLCDEAYLDLFWDKTEGDPVGLDPESGDQEPSGDCVLRIHAPWNVARDPGLTVEQQKWHIISYRVNKFDSAATYPKFAESIIAAANDDLPSIPMNGIPEGSDAIWAHLLVHDRTAKIPSGRYSLMIAQKIVLDSILPYPDYPVERMAGSDVIDGPVGYSNANDILGMEELTDALHSIIATNQTNFGGQCLVGPEGNNIKWSDLAKGSRLFELPADMVDKLKVLDMLHTPPEIFNYIGILDNKKAQQVGVNSIVRGNPEGALAGAPASAMALLQSQAISFNSGTQRAYFKTLSNTMTKCIGILRKYADTPRIAMIVGKSKAAGLKQFKYTGQDLSAVSSIVYEMINPIAQTQGGRMTFAKDLLDAGQIKSPKQYINLAMTGQMDVLTEDDESDGILILEENEALIEGRPVKALITEIHADHIKSHNSLITQEAKEKDPDLVQRVLAHNQEHINIWFGASQNNPAILIATGQQPLPMPQQPQLPPPGPQPGADEGAAKVMGSGMPPAVLKAGEIKQPPLPTIAGTKDTKPTVPGVTQ